MNKEIYELTNPQKSIWFTEHFFKNTSIANVSGTCIIEDVVDFKKLEQAINLVMKNNLSLRLRIILKDGIPMQYVDEFSPIKVETFELEKEEDLPALESHLVLMPFSLIESSLIKFTMFRFSDKTGGFVIVANHMLSDAWAAGMLNSQVVDFYTKLLHNESIPEQPQYSYLDFIKTEKNYMQSNTYLKDRDFWEDKFKDISEFAFLSNTSTTSPAANRVSFQLSHEFCNMLNVYCKNHGASPFAIFMAVFAIYLNRLSNLDNIVIETPVLNRANFKEKNCLGMFISTIPFDIKINQEITFKEFLANIVSNQRSCFRHQKYPYEHLLKSLREKNNFSSNLYDVAISYQNARNSAKTSSVKYHTHWNFNGNVANSLDIHIYDLDNTGCFQVFYDYQIDKFNDAYIKKLHDRLINIFEQIFSVEDILLSDIKIVTKDEEQQLLYKFNDTFVPYDKTKTLIDLFEEQVKKTPNHIAAILKDKRITYKELSKLVDAIALRIKQLNIKTDKIATMANKSFETLASFIAIMKTGNAYIPIDPTYPTERIKYILDDSNCELLIGFEKYLKKYTSKKSIILDNIVPYEGDMLPTNACPEDLAYIIYTSGTTGKPKGVKIQHKNVINTLLWRKDFYNFDSSIIVLQTPSFSFDSSVEDTFVPLISGSTLVFPATQKLDINLVCEQIKKHGVNHMLVVPSLYKVLLKEKSEFLKNFKFITIAGENFNLQLVKEHFEKLPNVRLVNEYGPTENSICSTFYELTKDSTRILIGKPIANNKCYVLDKTLNLLPVGVMGELYVSGPGVSPGYLDRQELTKERFIKSKFSDEIFYKTGDIVCSTADGNLEFISRNDSQIKLNGLRIELQEIDEAILKYGNIDDTITIVRDINGKKMLISYLASNKEINQKSLIDYLRSNLPYYMIPTIVALPKMPLTPNGKIDKSKLPIPQLMQKSTFDKPENELENKVLEIFQESLNNKELSVNDDFFNIGLADSLSILTISSRLFNVNIKVDTQDFYKYPTVRELSNFIADMRAGNINKVCENFVTMKYKTLSEDIDNTKLEFIYKQVLLTGSTGFLGAHILQNLLINTNCEITCIVRSKNNRTSTDRLKHVLELYFGYEFYEKYKNRLNVLDGELSENNLGLEHQKYEMLKNKIDCIIHTAAITKHYGNYQIFYKENVSATKHIIEFAKQNHVILNYMSTTTISGNYLVKNELTTNFNENDFYIGQNFEENVYVRSKFEAERLIFEEQYYGLNANVFRLGNLMARASDGVFQVNKYDNAYYTRLIALAKIGYVPSEFNNKQMEFSPIDDVAEAIITLLKVPSLKNKVFHLLNPFTITTTRILRLINKMGLKCEFTSYNTFLKELDKHPDIMKFIVSDFDKNKKLSYYSSITMENDITEQILAKLGFKWTKIDEKYVENMLEKNDFIGDTNESYEKY